VTPLARYQEDLLKPTFFADDAQLQAITMLQRLFDDLLLKNQTKPALKSSLIQRFFSPKPTPLKSIKGIYFYGGVGRGKTYLVDLFFHSIDSTRKQRLHFHHFMKQVHKKLTELQGQVDPLKEIAKQFASETDIICFDEFYVEDITDAMILAGMFEALFAEGVVLVATSNIHPEHLYRNGLQRARFLPAIGLIKQHCEIFNLDGGKDYRLGRLIDAEMYYYPIDESTVDDINNSFEIFAGGDKQYNQVITINDRPLTTIANSADTLSIEFKALCDGPRSVNDYIELAILYRTVLVSNIPQMNDQHNDISRRFIAMVDEFYDRNVVLIMSAEVSILDLYKGTRLAFEFQRCVSRLLEMQSKYYLSKAHHLDL
jgi:cell division protein ZapE